MQEPGKECTWILERIEPYVDDELHGEELGRFERHIESCESCAKELALAREVAHELRELPWYSCPEHVSEEAAIRIGADADEAGRTWLDRLRARFSGGILSMPRPAVAAALIVIVAAVVLVLSQKDLPFFTGGAPSGEQEVTVEELEKAKNDAILALAYVSKYCRKSGEILQNQDIAGRLNKPLEGTSIAPIRPFPLIRKETP